jgi:hypothetical protein
MLWLDSCSLNAGSCIDKRLPHLLGALLVIVGLFQGQPQVYQRGDVVRCHDVSKPAVFKVIGIPADRIRADETGAYVNDVAVTGFSPEFLTLI